MLFRVVPFVLLAATVLAISPNSGARATRRSANRQSQILDQTEQVLGTASDERYSKNWAGAVWLKGDHTFTSVTGTFTVPTPSGKSGTSASAWVGIDGVTCQSAILQTGIDITVSDKGPVYDAWYEFYPAPALYFPDFTIHAGDTLRLTVTADSPNAGKAMIENLTRGKKVSQDVFSPPPASLCGQNAEWIVEDYMLDFAPVVLDNFGMVTFTDAKATGTGTYTPNKATIVDIKQNGKVLTSTSTKGSSVTIKYIGK